MMMILNARTFHEDLLRGRSMMMIFNARTFHEDLFYARTFYDDDF